MGQTSIEWTDHTINPIRASNVHTGKVGHYCEKISPGCASCYASTFNEKRYGTGVPFIPGRRQDVQLFLDGSKLAEVLRRKKPTRYFWCDMTDLFYDGHNNEWLNRCFATMALTPQHTHQVLTKRPERMRQYMGDPDRPRLVAEWMAGNAMVPATYRDGYRPPWPLPNVWLGVSVEDQQRADERIPLLLRTPAAVRFVSAEPLLGPVDLMAIKMGCGWRALDCACSAPGCDHETLDWLIVGGESGPEARPCHLDWVRDLVAQCREASVACFVKQLGARLHLRDRKGGSPEEWPEDLRVRQWPEVPIGVLHK